MIMSWPWAIGPGPTRSVLIPVRRIYTTGGILTSSFLFRGIHTEGSKPNSTPVQGTGTETNIKQPEALKEKTPGLNFSLDVTGIRTFVQQRANEIASTASSSLFELGGQLNRMTGYERIEILKHRVVETEIAIAAKRRAAREAKAAYEDAAARRSISQREVNESLQKKATLGWTNEDVTAFTARAQSDHLCEQEALRTKRQVELAEAAVESEFDELMRTILNRYHEEQVWSDKIRSASTYGSMLVLSVNVLVFIIAIMLVEPWKRRRLVETFQKRVEQLSAENRDLMEQHMGNLTKRLEAQELLIAGNLASTDYMPPIEPYSDLESSILPVQSLERTAKAALDRNVWIAGVIGAVGGAAITLVMSAFR